MKIKSEYQKKLEALAKKEKRKDNYTKYLKKKKDANKQQKE